MMELLLAIATLIGLVASIVQLIDFWQKRQEKRRKLSSLPIAPSPNAESPIAHSIPTQQDWG
ncbi:MAG: hypothetical protein HC881_08060, partial [Leptolyngbyaceae cyanobacterium SL_7_1]|nr:hypothetical protein [Leptolyngbyaceae cyanobacterium SL_7_1]